MIRQGCRKHRNKESDTNTATPVLILSLRRMLFAAQDPHIAGAAITNDVEQPGAKFTRVRVVFWNVECQAKKQSMGMQI